MLAVPELLVCWGSLLPLMQILSVVKWFSVLDVHWDLLTETFKKKKKYEYLSFTSRNSDFLVLEWSRVPQVMLMCCQG